MYALLLSVDFYGELLGETQTAAGNVLFELPAILEEFFITFDFWVEEFRNDHQGLFRVSNTTNRFSKPGDRAPSVTFSNTQQLQVYYEMNGKVSQVFKRDGISKFKWYNVTLQQTHFNGRWTFNFFLDNWLVNSDSSPKRPNTYRDVKVSAVEVEKPPPPNSKIRDVKVWTSECVPN